MTIAAFLGESIASPNGARLMDGKDYQSQCDWMTPIGNFYSNIRFASLLIFQGLTDKGQLSGKTVERHVRLAIAAGWIPEERGKPFVFEVPEKS